MNLEIQNRRVDQLRPYNRKLRRNDHAVRRMAASIQEFGFRIPVLATSSGEIIDGDLRVKAAGSLGISDVPVIVCDDWTEAQVRAFRLLVNRSATWANWNFDAVTEELADLKALDFDLTLTGFDGLEIEQMLAGTQGFSTIDEPSDGTLTPVSRPGDLWVCRGHRVLCGDARKPVTWTDCVFQRSRPSW
jgi:hypothetical protein